MDEAQSSDRPTTIRDEAELSPEESLALIRSQRGATLRRLYVDPALILGVWGIAWLVGFGGLYLTSGRGPGGGIPTWSAGAILTVLLVAAAVVTFGEQIGHTRGVEGPSQRIAAMYGWSWILAFAALFAFDLAIERQGLPAHLAPLVWTGSALLVVGLLYLAGGMLWGDRLQYVLGVWVLATGAGSIVAGVPGNFAVLSLAGGGGLLVAAVVARSGGGRPDPAVA